MLLFLTALAVLPSDPEPAGSDRVLDGWARPLTAKSCVLLLHLRHWVWAGAFGHSEFHGVCGDVDTARVSLSAGGGSGLVDRTAIQHLFADPLLLPA